MSLFVKVSASVCEMFAASVDVGWVVVHSCCSYSCNFASVFENINLLGFVGRLLDLHSKLSGSSESVFGDWIHTIGGQIIL